MGCGYLLRLQSHLPPGCLSLFWETFRDHLSLADGIWKQASADPSRLKYLRINDHEAFDDFRSNSFLPLSSTTAVASLLFGLNFAGNLLANDSHVPLPTLLKQKPHILPPSGNHTAAGLSHVRPWRSLQEEGLLFAPGFTQIPPLLVLLSLHSWYTSDCILVVVINFIFIK